MVRADGSTTHIVIAEAQSEPDPEKLWTWPHYTTTARARYRAPTTLVVIALSEPTAAWARVGVWMGGNGHFAPVVFGPSEIRALPPGGPAVEALRVIANSAAPDAVDLAKVAVASASGMDDLAFGRYIDLILDALPALAANLLEAWMHERWEPQSNYIRRHWLAGRIEGLEEGREEGLEQGLEQGLQKGVTEGTYAALVSVGTSRWGAPSANHTAALRALDAESLLRCVVLALEATGWDDLLAR